MGWDRPMLGGRWNSLVPVDGVRQVDIARAGEF